MNTTVSVVIPAYNEQEHIANAIQSIQHAFEDTELTLLDLIVSDDDSTDDTAAIANHYGAQIIRSGKRNIGATRNTGASIARGEWLLFVDADTYIEHPTIIELKKAIQDGVIGGGARLGWNGKSKLWGELLLLAWNAHNIILRSPPCAFFYIRKDIFNELNGFNENLYAYEELDLAKRAKKHGKFRILSHSAKTSARKMYLYSMWDFILFFIKVTFWQKKTLTNRKNLNIWYPEQSDKKNES